jgi:hypothetical protein
VDTQPTPPNTPQLSEDPTVWEYLTSLPRRWLAGLRSGETPVPAPPPEPPAAPVAEKPAQAEALSPAIAYQVTSQPAEGPGGMHVHIDITLPPDTSLQVTLSARPGEAPVVVNAVGLAEPAGPPAAAALLPPPPARMRWPTIAWQAGLRQVSQQARRLWRWKLPTSLFALALLIYLITHLTGLLRYPIYFFSDEAMQPLFAQTLMQNRFVDKQNDIFLPLYVEVDGNRWAPLLPMYFHALTMSLFGKTAVVTRATSAIFSILAALAVSLTLKQVYRALFWWVGALVLAVLPAWFLHSRTAFETVSATTLYALFLWLYLRYRTGSPRAIYGAAVCAAGAFYCYTNAQAVLGLTGLLLLIFDARYHWQQRRTLAWLIPLGVFLALPLIIFEWRNPAAISLHLRVVDSYWFHDIPLAQKITTLIQKYAYGLSPQYWFFSNGQDLERHRFGPYPHIWTVFLPFFLLGLIVCLRKIRCAEERSLLLAAFAVPVGAAQLDIGMPRVLMFVIPASILIVLGWEWLWQAGQRWLARLRLAETIAHWALFYALAFGSLAMLGNALENGPLWFRNYGLYGMQYGAVQLFGEEIPRLLSADPAMRLIVTPTWANATHRYADFFLTPEQRANVQMGNIEAYLARKLTLPPNQLFVMTPEELTQATQNPKLAPPIIEKVIAYPDGNPGFYFTRWAYSLEADALFAAEQAERMTLLSAEVMMQGQPLTVRHSWNDMGSSQDMFDNDVYTLMRGLEANPLVVELNFPGALSLSGVTSYLGKLDAAITATVTLEGSPTPLTFSGVFPDAEDSQALTIAFDGGPYRVTTLRLEYLERQPGDQVHIHIREIELIP